MGCQQQIDLLKAGSVRWNAWRKENPNESIDLTYAILDGANLSRANLSKANLTGAHLDGADLTFANLSGADLTSTKLNGANLTRANLNRSFLISTIMSDANLSQASLIGATLRTTALDNANMSGADTRGIVYDQVYYAGVKAPGQITGDDPGEKPGNYLSPLECGFEYDRYEMVGQTPGMGMGGMGMGGMGMPKPPGFGNVRGGTGMPSGFEEDKS